MLAQHLEIKAPGRVVQINPTYTSQMCHGSGHVDGDSRENQAANAVTACGYEANADVNVNAARVIAVDEAIVNPFALARVRSDGNHRMGTR